MHVVDYAQKAVAMAQGEDRDALETDEKLRLALTHLVELIGEAATHVPMEIQRAHPEIPWAQVVGMRNRLIHGYDFVDNDILWATITRNLPGLIVSLNRILQD